MDSRVHQTLTAVQRVYECLRGCCWQVCVCERAKARARNRERERERESESIGLCALHAKTTPQYSE